jgi:hypothetical protein
MKPWENWPSNWCTHNTPRPTKRTPIKYALKFIKTNKYDPKAAVSALRKLEKMYGNDSSVFSSHPAPGDRADVLEKTI